MSQTKTKFINEIEYKYIKNKKSKSIKIAIKDRFLVNVTLPFACPYKIAENFVKEKQGWIKKNLEIFDSNIIDENFQTKTGNLIISTGLIENPVIKKTGRIIQFIYPIGKDFYSKEIQDKVKIAVKKALYIEAKEYLPKRIDELAQKFGFKYGKIALKAHKSRWGSCSFCNNINLNINLMCLDKNFIDYVLIHELCHTIEKNHQENFWNLVEKCMPEAKKIRAELKKEKMTV